MCLNVFNLGSIPFKHCRSSRVYAIKSQQAAHHLLHDSISDDPALVNKDEPSDAPESPLITEVEAESALDWFWKNAEMMESTKDKMHYLVSEVYTLPGNQSLPGLLDLTGPFHHA